jgi:hypothetical protein
VNVHNGVRDNVGLLLGHNVLVAPLETKNNAGKDEELEGRNEDPLRLESEVINDGEHNETL